MTFEKYCAGCRAIAAACVTALSLSACSSDPGPVDSTDADLEAALSSFEVETTEDGSIESVASSSAADPQSPEESAADELVEKAGCVHIRFCNAPGPDEVVCDTNDRPCSRAARLEECFDDADAVCGNWTRMRFDPPI